VGKRRTEGDETQKGSLRGKDSSFLPGKKQKTPSIWEGVNQFLLLLIQKEDAVSGLAGLWLGREEETISRLGAEKNIRLPAEKGGSTSKTRPLRVDYLGGVRCSKSRCGRESWRGEVLGYSPSTRGKGRGGHRELTHTGLISCRFL